MPSFVARVERPEPRRRVGRLPASAARPRPSAGRRGWGSTAARPATTARRSGCCTSTATRTACSPRCCSRRARRAEERHAGRGRALSDDERARALADLVGERRNRRHRPGRGFEALRYRFEIVSDYGAFRDLQRHRMLTVQWQAADARPRRRGPRGGRRRPAAATSTPRALERSRAEYERLAAAGLADAAPYALCLGYRIRYVLDLNAREAMHLIELRSGREGHPTYRAVAHELHAQIAARPPGRRRGDDARRPLAEPRLERILSEMRHRGAPGRAGGLTRAVAAADVERGRARTRVVGSRCAAAAMSRLTREPSRTPSEALPRRAARDAPAARAHAAPPYPAQPSVRDGPLAAAALQRGKRATAAAQQRTQPPPEALRERAPQRAAPPRVGGAASGA